MKNTWWVDNVHLTPEVMKHLSTGILQDMCAQYQLDIHGTKPELIARLEKGGYLVHLAVRIDVHPGAEKKGMTKVSDVAPVPPVPKKFGKKSAKKKPASKKEGK